MKEKIFNVIGEKMDSKHSVVTKTVETKNLVDLNTFFSIATIKQPTIKLTIAHPITPLSIYMLPERYNMHYMENIGLLPSHKTH